MELWKTAAIAPDGTSTFPAADAATLLTVLSHPLLPFFILLTTESVVGGGGGRRNC